jgi:hypothetical protein
VDGLALDRLLGLVLEGALAVRDYARRARAPRLERSGGVSG